MDIYKNIFGFPGPSRFETSDQERDLGNQKFRIQKYYLALSHYNKALVLAREDKVRASLCYANRSAVYLELKNFKHCLHNIDMAERNYPRDKIQKLYERRERCLKMMENINDQTNEPFKYPFKLSYEPNSKLSFFIDAIQLKEDEIFGKHLITTRNLKAGDVIAVIDNPWRESNANIGEEETVMIGCYNCMKLNNLDLIPGKCQALFCSEACRNEHEKEEIDHDSFHDMESKGLARRYIFSTRIFLKFLDALGGFEKLKEFYNDHEGNKYTVFDFDWTIKDESTYDKNLLLTFMSVYIEKKPDQVEPMQRVIWSQFMSFIMWQMPDNRFKKIFKANSKQEEFWKKIMWHIWDAYDAKVQLSLNYDVKNVFGTFHHPAMFVINHSCDPNIFVHINDCKEIVWTVNQPIPAGGQIFCSYNGESYYAENNFELETCPSGVICVSCQNGWAEMIDDSEILHDSVLNSMKFIKTNHDVENLANFLEYVRSCCDFINENFTDNYYNNAEIRRNIATKKSEIRKILQTLENPFSPSISFYMYTMRNKKDLSKFTNNLNEEWGKKYEKKWNRLLEIMNE